MVASEPNASTGAGCPVGSVGGAVDVTGVPDGDTGSGSSSVLAGSAGGDGDAPAVVSVDVVAVLPSSAVTTGAASELNLVVCSTDSAGA